MGREATGQKLGRLVGRARSRSAETGDGLWAKARGVRRHGERAQAPELASNPRAVPNRTVDASGGHPDPELIDLDRSDALARAEAAEAEVERLRTELAHKEEILAEARIALRTARLALRDHLRITQR